MEFQHRATKLPHTMPCHSMPLKYMQNRLMHMHACMQVDGCMQVDTCMHACMGKGLDGLQATV